MDSEKIISLFDKYSKIPNTGTVPSELDSIVKEGIPIQLLDSMMKGIEENRCRILLNKFPFWCKGEQNKPFAHPKVMDLIRRKILHPDTKSGTRNILIYLLSYLVFDYKNEVGIVNDIFPKAFDYLDIDGDILASISDFIAFKVFRPDVLETIVSYFLPNPSKTKEVYQLLNWAIRKYTAITLPMILHKDFIEILFEDVKKEEPIILNFLDNIIFNCTTDHVKLLVDFGLLRTIKYLFKYSIYPMDDLMRILNNLLAEKIPIPFLQKALICASYYDAAKGEIEYFHREFKG